MKIRETIQEKILEKMRELNGAAKKNERFSLLRLIAPNLPGAASAACDSSDYLVVARTIRMVADGVRRVALYSMLSRLRLFVPDRTFRVQ